MTRIGLDCKLYRNTGTVSTPVWDEIVNARDVTIPLTKAEAEASRRGGKWKLRLGTLKDASIDFQLIQEDGDADFTALFDSFANGTPIELLAANGPVASAGTQGLRAWCEIFNFQDGQPLEGAQTFDVSAKPTVKKNDAGAFIYPTWFGPVAGGGA